MILSTSMKCLIPLALFVYKHARCLPDWGLESVLPLRPKLVLRCLTEVPDVVAGLVESSAIELQPDDGEDDDSEEEEEGDVDQGTDGLDDG